MHTRVDQGSSRWQPQWARSAKCAHSTHDQIPGTLASVIENIWHTVGVLWCTKVSLLKISFLLLSSVRQGYQHLHGTAADTWVFWLIDVLIKSNRYLSLRDYKRIPWHLYTLFRVQRAYDKFISYVPILPHSSYYAQILVLLLLQNEGFWHVQRMLTYRTKILSDVLETRRREQTSLLLSRRLSARPGMWMGSTSFVRNPTWTWKRWGIYHQSNRTHNN